MRKAERPRISLTTSAFGVMLSCATASAWTFDTQPDKMGRGEVRYATVRTSESFELGFPYSGPQHAQLLLRVHPQYGRDVILEIERGQFMCRIDGCRVLVRFDDGKPQTFSGSESGDNNTTVIFIHGFDNFVLKARKAKRVMVQATIYQAGDRIFEFDTSGLGEWPNANPAKKSPSKVSKGSSGSSSSQASPQDLEPDEFGKPRDPKCIYSHDGVKVMCR